MSWHLADICQCDGRTPSCSRCSSRMIPCEYIAEADKRRPNPTSHVLLERRATLLESVRPTLSMWRNHCPTTQNYLGGCTRMEHQAKKTRDQFILYRYSQGCIMPFPKLKAPKVEASLNFDQDGEFRYFGPSGRLHLDRGRSAERSYSSTHQCTMADGVSARKNQLIQSVTSLCGAERSILCMGTALVLGRQRAPLSRQRKTWRTILQSTPSELFFAIVTFTDRVDARSDPIRLGWESVL